MARVLAWNEVSTSGTRAMTLHQLPGVPVAVPGSATGSRSPNRRSYASRTWGAASERGTWRRRVICDLLRDRPVPVRTLDELCGTGARHRRYWAGEVQPSRRLG